MPATRQQDHDKVPDILLQQVFGRRWRSGDRVGHRLGKKLDEVAHHEFPAVVRLQKFAQDCLVGIVRPRQTVDEVHEVLNLLRGQRAAPVVIPGAKEGICQKGGRPGPPKAHGLCCVHVQVPDINKVCGVPVACAAWRAFVPDHRWPAAFRLPASSAPPPCITDPACAPPQPPAPARSPPWRSSCSSCSG